jgi:hypothetical protein
MPRPHNQLGATRLVALQVHVDQSLDHVALTLPHAHHVDRSGTGHRPERGRAVDQVGDLRAPDFVLARETVGVWARAPNQLAFHDGRTMSGLCHVPGQIFARLATAENDDVIRFRLSHGDLLALRVVRRCRVLRMGMGHPMVPWSSHCWDCTAIRVPTLKHPGLR